MVGFVQHIFWSTCQAKDEATFDKSGLAGDKFKDLEAHENREKAEAKLQLDDPRVDRYMQD